MGYMSKDEIQKLAAELRKRHKLGANNPGAALRVSSGAGGVNLGKLTASLSPIQKTPGAAAAKEEAPSLPPADKQ